MKNYESDLASKQKEVAKIEKKKEKSEELLKEKKKEQGKVNRILAKIEQDIREVVRTHPQRLISYYSDILILLL